MAIYGDLAVTDYPEQLAKLKQKGHIYVGYWEFTRLISSLGVVRGLPYQLVPQRVARNIEIGIVDNATNLKIRRNETSETEGEKAYFLRKATKGAYPRVSNISTATTGQNTSAPNHVLAKNSQSPGSPTITPMKKLPSKRSKEKNEKVMYFHCDQKNTASHYCKKQRFIYKRI